MIELVNRELVPVWLNVRTTPLPRRAWVEKVLLDAQLDGAHRVTDAFSRGFFVRTFVVGPDGDTLLTPAASSQPTLRSAQGPSLAGSVMTSAVMGGTSFTSVDPGDILSLLSHALARFHQIARR